MVRNLRRPRAPNALAFGLVQPPGELRVCSLALPTKRKGFEVLAASIALIWLRRDLFDFAGIEFAAKDVVQRHAVLVLDAFDAVERLVQVANLDVATSDSSSRTVRFRR